MKELTDRQKEMLDFIKECINSKGFPPSIQEIQDNFGFKSPTGVNDHLNALAKKGYIFRHQGISRGIELIDTKKEDMGSSDSFSIPLVGQIAAGTPIHAQENIEYNISIDKFLFGNTDKLFALKVKGDSMINAGIFDGDYAVIRSQSTVERGEIGVVMIDEEATLKRIFINKDTIKLLPENDTMKPIVVQKGGNNISIVGKLEGVIRKI